MPEPTTGTHDDWDTHWDQYADAARENPAQRMRHEIISALLTVSAKGGQARVFDIGSGQGDMVELLSKLEPGSAVSIVDAHPHPSMVAIEQAAAAAPRLPLGPRAKKG